jgi:hypothetical protein
MRFPVTRVADCRQPIVEGSLVAPPVETRRHEPLVSVAFWLPEAPSTFNLQEQRVA